MTAVTIQVRRDTAANWTSANPTLATGEWGYETDTALLKIGNGSTAWNSLAYSLVTATGTQTLTNKTLTSPTLNTPTINTPTLTGSTLAAGTSSVAPLKFTSGTNLTTASAGALEYDGSVFYADIASSTRGTVSSEQMVVLNTAYTLTSQTAAQKLFNNTSNGAVTLPVGTYQFEGFFSLSSMSASSSSFGFALGGAATFTQEWWSVAEKGTATLTTATATQSTYNVTAANTAITTNSANTVGYAWIRGILNVTVAGTVIPQVSLGVAAAAVVGVGSFFKVSPFNGTNSTTNVTVGNWS
jgi:hypothetical protein